MPPVMVASMRSREMPKSVTFASIASSSRMFFDFKSRWITGGAHECKYVSAIDTWSAILTLVWSKPTGWLFFSYSVSRAFRSPPAMYSDTTQMSMSWSQATPMNETIRGWSRLAINFTSDRKAFTCDMVFFVSGSNIFTATSLPW
ncbi:hypothetical protein GQ600_11958 [Phytophthora cactorum]|nr:hypothetical protein GQ600_5035 [Phytophthora cactorum]KAF1795014.1 hypothetical protein GQ600_11958 [Phytophthora cactorum]